MIILQRSSADSCDPCTDGTPAVTPSDLVDQHLGPSSTVMTGEASAHGGLLDTGSSDASQSSREHTDASSVDSLDIVSVEKPRPKNVRLRSLKNTVVAMYQKRKSVTTPTTPADDLVVLSGGPSPEATRRCSAPHERSPAPSKRPAAGKLYLPVPGSRLSEPSKSADRQQKRPLHTCKSDGEGTSPTEDKSHVGGRLDMVDGSSLTAPQTAPVLLHKPDSMKLVVAKMNRKLRTCLHFTSRASDHRQMNPRGDGRVNVVDLSSEDVPMTPAVLALTYSELVQLGRSS